MRVFLGWGVTGVSSADEIIFVDTVLLIGEIHFLREGVQFEVWHVAIDILARQVHKWHLLGVLCPESIGQE